jgi:hypothetical protein
MRLVSPSESFTFSQREAATDGNLRLAILFPFRVLAHYNSGMLASDPFHADLLGTVTGIVGN